MSLTTVATSSAPGEYAALAATTWLVSLMAVPDHSPNAESLSPRACPMIGYTNTAHVPNRVTTATA